MHARCAPATAAVLCLLAACAVPFAGEPRPVPSLQEYKDSFAAAAGERFVAAASVDDLAVALRTARVLYLGDQHVDQLLHQRQLRLLTELHGRGFRLQLALEAVATQDEYLVDFWRQDRIGMLELRRTVLRRWRDSWFEDGDVDGSSYRECLLLAKSNGWPVRGLEPAPRVELSERDPLIADAVRRAADEHPDRLLVVQVGQSHLLGHGDLIRRVGLPAVAIAATLPPQLIVQPSPQAPAHGFLRSDAGLWFFARD